MALSNISFERAQGNLSTPLAGEDHISALIFDVTAFPGSSADGDIFEVFSVEDAESIGVTEFDGSVGATNYQSGIPHLHISEFFRVNPGSSLFISFADCSSDWNIIGEVQSLAQGKVRQFGVWTRQKLWAPGATVLDPYTLRLLSDMNAQASALAAINQPASILLSANLTSIDAAGDTTNISLITDISGANYPRVTPLIGQGHSAKVRDIQEEDATHATVGCVGAALGLVSRAPVGESIAWVSQYDISGGEMDTVSLGFGDIGVTGDELNNVYPLDSLTNAQLNALESKGYVFPMKYKGTSNPGTFMSSDRAAASGTDYDTISKNRTIDKSRRVLRSALLPFLNSSVKISPSTGQISAAQVKLYKVACENQLQAMQDAGEISGFQVRIDPTQKILISRVLNITYSLVPNGTAKDIKVKEGFTLSTSS